MFQNEVRGVFVRLSVLVRIYPQYQKDFFNIKSNSKVE